MELKWILQSPFSEEKNHGSEILSIVNKGTKPINGNGESQTEVFRLQI